ncbi:MULTISPECIES: chemotaxis protein CheW [Pseudomonas]|uniref:Chemotaxis protein CheW n=1 Tax=Pseudomonas cichorii TaxID=36746 RepID=A0A3M4WH06_PSECI|nr:MULTISPECIES: chemotaxis protein CheW [Pseudomonas]AHF68852.1 putative CheW protein [Pseudomonas cichorii JBC1]MBX8495646.1 chemotaxis protein CheW [Pseudomonas cichorii]MBX8517370.1 chemotaxis protein CheW [Pseudomonas cichorii]MBX8519348.1 chemotaxis protein CheW [Pseudomonas cichorii]MBX8532678.1 chemotaxis protein CheW [Pseudomonas cichorii]
MSLPQTVERLSDADTMSIQHLSFRVRDAAYALPIDLVREIIEYDEVTSVPMMPAFIHGVINLRGNVVPVLDLAARFGFELTTPGKRTCIVIIELTLEDLYQRIGLVVDAVDAVLDIDPQQVVPAPPFGAGIRTDFIAGMARRDQTFTIILNIAQVLSLDDIRQLSLAVLKGS